MKLLVLTRYERKGASSRVRFYQFYPYLEAQGFQITTQALLSDHYIDRIYTQGRKNLAEMFKGYIRRIFLLLTAKRFDALWIEKELFPGLPAWAERYLQWRGVRMVIDYDDAIFHNYDLLASRFTRFLLRNKIAEVMRAAAVVVAGNAYIAEYAQKTGTHAVQIIPSVVDTEKYKPAIREPNPKPVVGWMGTPSTIRYVRSIVPRLLAVQKEHPFILRIVGAQFQYPGLEVECVPWSEETEVEVIQGFDIGIMPLDDTHWERGKCGYKLIQYMACGVPVIGSGIGANLEIMQDKAGLVAKNVKEWNGLLLAMLENPSLREQYGRAGQNRVEYRYSQHSVLPRFKDVFR